MQQPSLFSDHDSTQSSANPVRSASGGVKPLTKTPTKRASRVRTLVGAQIPQVGDKLIHGLAAAAVMGYDAATRELLFARTYAEKDNPRTLPIDELTMFTDTTGVRWWVNKSQLTKRIGFAVTFPWFGGETTLPTRAVSIAQARQNVLYRVGKELCQKDPDAIGHGPCVENAKYQIGMAAGTTYRDDLLKIVPSLRF